MIYNYRQKEIGMDTSKIKGFVLKNRVKGKETTTKFSKKDFALFKEWIEICQKNGFEFNAYVITQDNREVPIELK